MIDYLLGTLFVAVAYLIGAIPFAYVIVYAVKRVDIRTVGSGNVGATNAGRLLGFKYFVLVFLLDLAKGLLPTLGFPIALAKLTGAALPGLPVFIALATILGHNFPVFLKFRGGKGVATSLGALFALDPYASAITFASFIVFLVVTRYVSLSSLGGGIVFLMVHFVRVKDPWGRGEIVMSLATIGLLGMLIVRHRKNLVRIGAGTEPKVSFRKKKTPPAAMILIPVIVAVLGSGTGVAYYATRPTTLDCGTFALEVTSVARTGHQRAERITFADQGKLVAVTCPRYNRVVLYRVDDGSRLTLVRDILLEGRPVDVRSSNDSLYVLQRPANDARHFEEAWWDRFDFSGRAAGPRFRVGFDPDDMMLVDHDRTCLVLLSGNAEEHNDRPKPSLRVVDLHDTSAPRVLGEVFFDTPGDDPQRVAYEPVSRCAVVSLQGTNALVWIDLTDTSQPKVVRRTVLPESGIPSGVGFDGQHRLLITDAASGRLWLVEDPGERPRLLPVSSEVRDATIHDEMDAKGDVSGEWIFAASIKSSSLEAFRLADRTSQGRLSLRGAGNLGKIHPMAVAQAADHVAIADKAGAVHLIAIRGKHAARGD